MKTMKQRKIYMGFIFAIGFIMVVLQNYVYKDVNNSIVGTMGTAFVVMSLLRLYQFRKIEGDPKRKEQFQIMCDEERVVFVANKARSMMFAIAVIAEFVVCVVAAIMGNMQLSVIFGFLTGVQTLGYLICYGIFNFKY
jgi:nicotinamide riboside transporter PnuC